MIQNNISAVLEKNSLIPVVTFNSLEEVNPMIDNLLSKNIHCIEITLRTPIAFDAIELAVKNINDIYKTIKKTEEKPKTDYLFSGLDNRSKSIAQMNMMSLTVTIKTKPFQFALPLKNSIFTTTAKN